MKRERLANLLVGKMQGLEYSLDEEGMTRDMTFKLVFYIIFVTLFIGYPLLFTIMVWLDRPARFELYEHFWEQLLCSIFVLHGGSFGIIGLIFWELSQAIAHKWCNWKFPEQASKYKLQIFHGDV